MQLGDYVRIGRGVEINSELANSKFIVGAGTWIGRKCRLDFTGGLVIGESCTLSEKVVILTHDHGLSPRSKAEGKILKIGSRVWIGENVTILHNVSEIGDNSIIGEGSVVTKSVPSLRPVVHQVAVGDNLDQTIAGKTPRYYANTRVGRFSIIYMGTNYEIRD